MSPNALSAPLAPTTSSPLSWTCIRAVACCSSGFSVAFPLLLCHSVDRRRPFNFSDPQSASRAVPCRSLPQVQLPSTSLSTYSHTGCTALWTVQWL